MDLVQNLKRTLNSWVDRILVAASCHYIKHLAKQTLKKQGNSSSTESSQNPLTQEFPNTTIVTSSADTSGKTTMKDDDSAKLINQITESMIDRASDPEVSMEDARAILSEFGEWIYPEHDEEVIILS